MTKYSDSCNSSKRANLSSLCSRSNFRKSQIDFTALPCCCKLHKLLAYWQFSSKHAKGAGLGLPCAKCSTFSTKSSKHTKGAGLGLPCAKCSTFDRFWLCFGGVLNGLFGLKLPVRVLGPEIVGRPAYTHWTLHVFEVWWIWTLVHILEYLGHHDNCFGLLKSESFSVRSDNLKGNLTKNTCTCKSIAFFNC